MSSAATGNPAPGSIRGQPKRVQLFALAYDPANILRSLALPTEDLAR